MAQASLLIRTPASSTSQFTMQGQLTLPGQVGRMAIGKVRGGSYPDLVVANRLGAGNSSMPPRTVSVIGVGKDTSGNSTLGPLAEYSVGAAPIDLALDDYDGNGKLDVAAATVEGGAAPQVAIRILLNQDVGGLPKNLDVLPTLNAGPGRCAFVISKDVNRDGKPDLVAANCGDTNNRTAAELHLFIAQR